MDVHCDCAEPTAVGEQPLPLPPPPPPSPPPPSGKLNKTAFKLFRRRKSGGAMPSIFGSVRSGKGKGEAGGQAARATAAAGGGGMVRSKTHDGLAEAALESGGKKEEDPEPERGKENPAPAACSPSSSAAAAAAAVGKSHSFFSLLRKNGRSGEGAAKGERPPKSRPGGLKGLFSSMRWPRRDKPGGGGGGEGGGGKEDEASEGPAALLMPGSLTASLECIKEEAPPRLPPRSPPPPPPEGLQPEATEDSGPQETTQDALEDAPELLPLPPLLSPWGEELPGFPSLVKESQPVPLDAPGPEAEEEPAITGCGDIIADQEDDGGSGGGGGGSDKSAPGLGKAGASKKPPGVVTYQGGGEEMASPEQVGDTCAPEFWDMLSQTEGKPQETARWKESPQASRDSSCAKGAQDGSIVGQHIGFNHSHKEDQKSREKEQQEAIPSGDEGYWDSTTPGPEEDNTNNIQKEVIPRDSYSGDALYDLYAEPEENTATVTSTEDVGSVTCSKLLSPVTTNCPVKTHTTSLKDSKIPISIKHFTSPHSSHGPDTSNSHHIAHHQPTKSEIPRTKIPVSKVLIHRASYRSLAGTTGKAATYHESAKK